MTGARSLVYSRRPQEARAPQIGQPQDGGKRKCPGSVWEPHTSLQVCVLPTHLRIPPPLTRPSFLPPPSLSQCLSPRSSPAPPALSPWTLLPPVQLSGPSPGPLLLAAHPCPRWGNNASPCLHPPGTSEGPCLTVQENKYLRMPHSAPAWCWEQGRQQTQSSPSLMELKLQRRKKVSKGVTQVSVQVYSRQGL